VKLTGRTMNYMILGMSLSGILELQTNPTDWLKAFSQLLHEYEYHTTHEPGSLSGKPKMVLSLFDRTECSAIFSRRQRGRRLVDQRGIQTCI